MCQPIPTVLYTRWDFVSKKGIFAPRWKKTRSFENMVLFCFQRTKPESKIERLFTTGRQQKFDRFSVDGFCSQCNPVSEAKGCFYHFCHCQEVRPSLTEENTQRGGEKRDTEELR